MIYVIASSELKDGCKARFVEIAKANIPNVLAEEGCISYVLNEDIDAGLPAQKEVRANVVTFVECWESLEHLHRHLQAPHMKAFAEKVRELRNSSALNVVTPV